MVAVGVVANQLIILPHPSLAWVWQKFKLSKRRSKCPMCLSSVTGTKTSGQGGPGVVDEPREFTANKDFLPASVSTSASFSTSI